MNRFLRLAFLGSLACAIALLAVLADKARIEVRLFQEEPLDNIYWNLTQLELDLVRFQSAVDLAIARPDDAETELRKRYDLFYSRINNFGAAATMARFDLEETVAPVVGRLKRFLDATTPLVDGAGTEFRDALPRISTDLEVLRKDLKAMTVQVIDLSARKADARRAGLTVLLEEVAWATLGLFALLFVLLGSVLYLNRRAERSINAANSASARLQATVETALDGVIVAGMDGRVIDFNKAAEQTFGYTAQEAIGARLEDLIVPPRHSAAHSAGMVRMATTGEKRVVDKGRIQITAVRKSGEEFPVELSIASSLGPDGTIFIAYLRDISRRLENEKAMLTARDEALAAGQAKTDFLAVMSHEMRTPLNGVMAALEIADRDAIDERQKKFIGLARSSAAQLMRHVNDVLDITRVDAGHLALANESFDLVQLASGLVEALKPVAAKSGTDLVLAPLSDLPWVQGDSFRIGQIVQNLLSNAIKFTKNGTVTVEIALLSQSAERANVELRVIDTGIGIAPADLDRVFDDFVMLDPSYGRVSGGTGLGLTISRRLAEAMGGAIGVESKEGEGSCFWLRLPLRIAKGRGPGRVDPGVAVAATRAETSMEELDVLVVEDNDTNRIVLEAMLTHLQHRVTLASDGAIGVELARDHRFDVVLMDISMPVMDGVTATGLIRSGGASSEARIVAVTAHTMPEELARFRAAGMDDYLVKPVSESGLAQALRFGGTQQVGDAGIGLPAVLDQARLQEVRAAMGEAGLGRVLTSFQASTSLTLDRIAEHATWADPAGLQALCHEAAGAAAMVGAARLYALLVEIESKCREADVAAARQLIPGLLPIWHDTVAGLSDLGPKA